MEKAKLGRIDIKYLLILIIPCKPYSKNNLVLRSLTVIELCDCKSFCAIEIVSICAIEIVSICAIEIVSICAMIL